jgi:hypothetical protein
MIRAGHPDRKGDAMDRRTFIKTAAAGTAVALQSLALGERCSSGGDDGGDGPDEPTYYGLHPFIESNSQAVFILRTNVGAKTDAAAMQAAGLAFGRSVFVKRKKGEAGARALTTAIALKPNIVCRMSDDPRYSIESTMGIVTDARFVEGVIQSLKEIGVAGGQFHILEVNCPQDFDDSGYWGVAERTGAIFKDRSAPIGQIAESEIQWVDVPSGVWFRKIPYFKPLGAANSWLLNIAKFKTHYMGLSLCAKNIQGAIAMNYQAHCNAYGTGMSIDAAHVAPNADSVIMGNYLRHVADGVPRWDRPSGDTGGLWMETWATRCLDNQSVAAGGLHVIEGVYGRDGYFIDGPSAEGLATDYMTNVIIFGKNQFNVDIVGCWLAGHEPGNFGLFHMARERGFISQISPLNIPVYEWTSGGQAQLTPLGNFSRAGLKTPYLQRDYNGQTEPLWHMVDEAFDYGAAPFVARLEPETRVWQFRRGDAEHGTSAIEITVPREDSVRLEILNARGEVVAVPLEGRVGEGRHLAVWNRAGLPSGAYRYRFRSGKHPSAGGLAIV